MLAPPAIPTVPAAPNVMARSHRLSVDFAFTSTSPFAYMRDSGPSSTIAFTSLSNTSTTTVAPTPTVPEAANDPANSTIRLSSDAPTKNPAHSSASSAGAGSSEPDPPSSDFLHPALIVEFSLIVAVA